MKKSKDRREGFPKITYRVCSHHGTHSTEPNEAAALDYAKRTLELPYGAAWVAVDRITVDRIYVQEKPG